MNLTRSIFLLSNEAEDFLCTLYRQTKITENAKLNFIAAVLSVSTQSASETAKKLHEIGLVRYEKYGCVSLTAEGRKYGKALIGKEQEILEKK